MFAVNPQITQRPSILGLLKEPDFQGNPSRIRDCGLQKEHSIFTDTHPQRFRDSG